MCVPLLEVLRGLSPITERDQPYIQAYSTVEKPQVEESVFSSC